jgi:hypothetical protein
MKDSISDRRLIEIILANQIQLFRKLEIVEANVHRTLEATKGAPENSESYNTANLDATVDKVLSSTSISEIQKFI